MRWMCVASTKLEKYREIKVSVVPRAINQIAFVAAVGVSLLIAPEISAQTTGATIDAVEWCVVTGANITTAEETGPDPVDTYRPADLEKLGIRNIADLVTFLPQEAGLTQNQNVNAGGGIDGTVQLNVRGILTKE